MDLSIVIVSFNVRYFLEQCLHAVQRASAGLETEVFVVDNNSVDGSAQMVAGKFPTVKLIINHGNVGFARANNQAIREASGRYVLLLNPDTLVQEDTFRKCMDHMDGQEDIGSLGVKMIDGKGTYLPESKRALPTPMVAFCKVFGLSALFPRSRIFGRYHLGYLDREKIHDVDVLSGAFMFIRRIVLEKAGLLDEDFFMYGEDIDLSYRIRQAGFRNVYFPLTTIIHYKGESTRKSSINYVIVFYKAMVIFAGKHFTGKSAWFYRFFIRIAIYFRAMVSLFRRLLFGIMNPLLDGLLVYSGYKLALPLWERHLFGLDGGYPPVYLEVVVPAYIGIWLLSVFLSTGYEKQVRLPDLAKGVVSGLLVILLIYALLPESLRFSRAMILFGAACAFISAIAVRGLLSYLFPERFSLIWSKRKKRIVIIGSLEEAAKVYSLIGQTQIVPDLTGIVDPEENRVVPGYIGHIGQISDIVRLNRADELIFCGGDLSSRQIITTMMLFTDTGLEFKIAPPESHSVIGSNTNTGTGELYVLHYNTLSRKVSRRKKHLFDITLSLVFVVISPVLLWFIDNKPGFFRNLILVLTGFRSWVGYFHTTGGDHPGLPVIRPGILTTFEGMPTGGADKDLAEKANLNYAKDYRVVNDLQIILKSVRWLGRNPRWKD